MSELTNGMRLRCQECGSEAIVLAAATAELTCCGAPMTVTVDPKQKES